MWKASIEGLEPLLGKTYEDRLWNPQDGRVVRLGLHRTIDASLENDVSMTLWACAADDCWPELRWLAEMAPDARAEFMRARPPRPRTMPTRAGAASKQSSEATPAPRAAQIVAAGEVGGVEVFRDDDDGYLAWVAAHPTGFIVNIQRSGNSSDARLHHARCRTVQRHQPSPRTLDRRLHQGLFAGACRARGLGSAPCRFADTSLRSMPPASTAALVSPASRPAATTSGSQPAGVGRTFRARS